MIYFTSDLHFFHQNILRHCDRPFASADEMNQVLIENWNRRVQPRDEVYILGDVTMKGADRAMEMLGQLCGRKYLIRGNHDYFVDQKEFSPYIFEWVKDYHELKQQNCLFVLCHYPFLSWHKMQHGAFNLHGHMHNKPEYNEKNKEEGICRYDVGVDANGFALVSIYEIMQFYADASAIRHEGRTE